MSQALAKKTKTSSAASASRKKALILTTMVAPGAIWLILLRYLPMFGIVLAFQDYKIYFRNPTVINNIVHSKFIALKNFEFVFSGTGAWQMIRNTIGYNVIFIVLGLVIAVAFAIMMNELTHKFVAKTYQTLMFFPYFLSWVVASYFVLAFLDETRGLLPRLMESWGMERYRFYQETAPWPYIIVIANLWKNIGYSTVLYLAAITGIDATQYEAASIDGATKWQQVKYVTLPHLKTMIVILLIMNVGKIFNSDFGLFWNVPMNSGQLIPVTQTIDTYVYRAMTVTRNIGMSTAAGLLQNIIGFVCIMTANTITRKIDPDSSLF